MTPRQTATATTLLNQIWFKFQIEPKIPFACSSLPYLEIPSINVVKVKPFGSRPIEFIELNILKIHIELTFGAKPIKRESKFDFRLDEEE